MSARTTRTCWCTACCIWPDTTMRAAPARRREWRAANGASSPRSAFQIPTKPAELSGRRVARREAPDELDAVHGHLPDVAVAMRRLRHHEFRRDRPDADDEVVAFEGLERRVDGLARAAVDAQVM